MSRYISITPDEAREILALAKEAADEVREPHLSVLHCSDGSYSIAGDPASVIVACEVLSRLASGDRDDAANGRVSA